MQPYTFDSTLNIQTIAQTFADCQTKLSDWLSDGVSLNLEAVETIDSAGLQLVAMICREMQQAGKPCTLSASSVVVAGFERLGMQAQLDLVRPS